jgi:hypothetical protein
MELIKFVSSTQIEWKRMPEIIWQQVFKCLDIKTFIQLMCTCHTLHKYTKAYHDIHEREAIRLYTSDLLLFADM